MKQICLGYKNFSGNIRYAKGHKEHYGDKRPLKDHGETHGYCPACYKVFVRLIKSKMR